MPPCSQGEGGMPTSSVKVPFEERKGYTVRLRQCPSLDGGKTNENHRLPVGIPCAFFRICFESVPCRQSDPGSKSGCYHLYFIVHQGIASSSWRFSSPVSSIPARFNSFKLLSWVTTGNILSKVNFLFPPRVSHFNFCMPSSGVISDKSLSSRVRYFILVICRMGVMSRILAKCASR